MSQIVKLRRSSTGGNRPTNSQLQLGELAINTTDGKLYFAKSGSLSASIEEVVTTNTQNTGSLNLSGSFNLIGTENITGSLNVTGSLRVLGNTSLISLVVSGSDPVANVQAFVPDSTVYNNASFNTPDRVAAGIRFNWSNENWTIGAARGATTDVDGLVFSRNGNRQMLLDENNNLVLSGSINLTGSFNINGTEYTSTTSGTSGSNGTNGSSGSSGSNGTDGSSGSSGSNGTNGSSGSSGSNGTNGSSGSSGTSGSNGTNGSSGSSGLTGANGTSGTSGSNGTNGSSGSSGSNGTNGSSGSSGSNGTDGSSGSNGSSGSSGSNGTNGSSGTSGDSLFALTGSVWETTNNAKVNGDLTITGTLTAKEIHTALVTSSVLYESGSTAFGNTFDDNHNFTGSVNITGSLYVNGAVVGTGKLNSTEFYNYTSSATSTIASSSYAQTASFVLNPIIVSGSTMKTTVTVAATTWSLNHGMNERYPSITVFDGDGYVVIPTGVRAIDTNNIQVYFSEAQTGTVIATLGGIGATGASGIGGYTQTYTSATTWSVAHNLNLDYPGITVWDSNRKVIIPSEITSIDSNNLQITFPIAQAGEVHIVRGGHQVSGSQDLSAVGTITPSVNGTYNLGSASKQFNNVYISGSLLVNGVPFSGGGDSTSGLATTGSNSFNGNQTITGSIDITGTYKINGVNVLTGSQLSVDSITFDRTAGINVTEGQIAWNNSDGTLDIGLNYGDVVLQVGQEQHFVVRNATGVVIENGTAVYASGLSAGSKRIEVSPFTANGTTDEVRFLGLATHNISDGVNGVVSNFGYVRGLDTRGTSATAISVGDETWAEGDILYAHPTAAGKLTKVAPKNKITVAMVTTRHQTTGVLFVRPSSFGHIDDLHDVQITTGSLVTGSMLEWNGDYFVNNNTFSSSVDIRLDTLENSTGSLATTGSNTFKGTQTFSGSLIPVGSGSYDLGSASNPFRHLYLSSASLYIDGQKVLGSTNQELQITTDTGQSFKILESGSDTITLQSADGDIQLKTSGGGNVLLDPTNGVLDLRGTVQIQDGFKITSSGGNSVVFNDDIIVSGSANFTGGITIGGLSYASATSGTSGSNGSSGTSGDSIFAQTGSIWSATKDVEITGSFKVKGAITADELYMTYVTSSVMYSSGSTKFGDTLDDTHQVTGSLSVTGSLLINGTSYTAATSGTSGSNGTNGSSGTSITTSGTTNNLTKFTSSTTVGNSSITDSGTVVSLTTGMNITGSILPGGATGTYDLGSATARWGTVYTSDLSLNNGIGNWTIVEGEDDLFLYNNKKGKVYKFALIEVDPSVATPKKS